MKILLLLSLLSYPMLIGCGKKTESDGKSATGNDGEAVESTNGVSAETSASPENQLIGVWASDFKKTLENLKVLKANSTDDFVKEKIYGPDIEMFEEGTNRDSWPVAMQTKFIIQFTKDGKMKAFAKGSEIIGTYSIIDTEDASLSWRLDGGIGGSEGLFITLDGDTLQISPPPDPASNPFPILFSRTEEPPEPKSEEAKVNAPTDSLADNIVGKVISLESEAYVGQIQQLQFNGDGRMMGGENGSIVDIGLTYKIEGNEVLVFKEEERDGGISFSSSSPKVGDQVEWGAEKEEIRGKITKIESADKILNDPVRQKRAAAKAAARAGQNRNFNLLKGIFTTLYSLYGKDGKLPDRPLEKEVIAAVGTDEYTRMKNPETGETRQVLYNLLTVFAPKYIILASPWVYGNQRCVIYGDGSGKLIDEEMYQQEIQKDEVEMRPFK